VVSERDILKNRLIREAENIVNKVINIGRPTPTDEESKVIAKYWDDMKLLGNYSNQDDRKKIREILWIKNHTLLLKYPYYISYDYENKSTVFSNTDNGYEEKAEEKRRHEIVFSYYSYDVERRAELWQELTELEAKNDENGTRFFWMLHREFIDRVSTYQKIDKEYVRPHLSWHFLDKENEEQIWNGDAGGWEWETSYLYGLYDSEADSIVDRQWFTGEWDIQLASVDLGGVDLDSLIRQQVKRYSGAKMDP
jgi:hypothetical protein